MDKIWHRGVIKYLQKRGLTPKDIHVDKFATLVDDAPALWTVQKWAAEFKRGRESLEDGKGPDILRQPPHKKHWLCSPHGDGWQTINWLLAKAVGISQK